MISWTLCTLEHWDVFTSFPYCFQKKPSPNKRKDTPTKQRKTQNKTRKIHQEQIPGLLFAHDYAETRGFHLSDESPTHATTTFTANRRVPNGPEVWQHWESARKFAGGTPEKDQRVTFGICWCGLDVGLGVFVEFVRTICSAKLLWKMLDGIWWNKYGTWVSKHLKYIEITLTAWKRMAWPLPRTRRWENSLMVLWRWSHFACMLELLSRVREIQRRELMVHFQGIFTDHFKLTRKADSYGNCYWQGPQRLLVSTAMNTDEGLLSSDFNWLDAES